MFSGSFVYTLDSKNRLSIPAKLRKNLLPEANETFMMTQGFGKCIDLYPLNEWQSIVDRLKLLNPFDPSDSNMRRMILSTALEVTMDNQSRIMLTQEHIAIAEIEKEVFILGNMEKIELWNPQIFKDSVNNTPENYQQLAAKVMTGK